MSFLPLTAGFITTTLTLKIKGMNLILIFSADEFL